MRKRQTTPPDPPNSADPAASRAPLTPPASLAPLAPTTPAVPAVTAAPARSAHPSADALSLWLAAEQAGSEEAAEAALAELCHMLPLAAPPSGFADRVVARTAALSAPLATPAPPALSARYRRARAWRWLPAAGLAAAVQVLTAPLWLPFLLRGFGAVLNASTISKVLLSAVDGVTASGRWIADLVTWSHTLLVLLRALVEPLATPPVAVLTLICLLMSTLALHWLHDLIERDRRWVHADPI